MDKKGTIWTVVGTAIALVFLVVVILGIFCPEKCVAPLLAAGSEGIADSQLGGIRKEKFEKTALEFNEQVEAAYSHILKALRSEGNGPCIMEHAPFPSDFKDSKIALSGTQDGTLVQLINKKGQMESKTVANRLPCTVGGAASENFYNNFLDGSICKANCPPNSVEANIVITSGNEIHINGEKRELKDGNLLFKTSEGNVCFFSIESDSGLTANFKCEKKEKGIDDDCFDGEIQENVISCDQTSTPFAQELIDKGYSKGFRDIAVEFSKAIKQAVNSEKEICRVEFSEYPDFGDDQMITMFNFNGNLQVDAQGKNREFLQVENNFVPCIVHGQNFWKWLWQPDTYPDARDSQYIDKLGVDLRGDGKNGVQFSPEDSDGKDRRDLYDKRPLIYKAGNGHICIMHVWDEGTCKMDTSIKRNAVAKGCLEKDNRDFLDSGRTPIC